MKSFTYLIGWSHLDIWYYGARWAIGCNPSDLWKTYFTSSSEVSKYRSEFGNPDIVEVRRVFADGDSARKWEECVLRRLGAVTSPRWLNLSNNGREFNNAHPETRAKLRVAAQGRTHSEATRLKMSASLTGKTRSAETRAKISSVVTSQWNDERRTKASKMMSEREIVPWTPERRERLASTWTPERREKFSQSKKDRWEGLSEERKAEIRAAKNAGIKASWERRRLAKAERTI